MSCDVDKARKGLENELRRRWSDWKDWRMSWAHSPSFPSFHLRQNLFSNPSQALPKSQLILQRFRCFTYVTIHSPALLSLLLPHSTFTYVAWRAAHGKESHRCCHWPLALLEMRDPGTSTVLTRYESMRLRSLRQSERTTARDPVQQKRWLICAVGRSIRNINNDGRADGVRRLPNIWQNVINKGGATI